MSVALHMNIWPSVQFSRATAVYVTPATLGFQVTLTTPVAQSTSVSTVSGGQGAGHTQRGGEILFVHESM